MSASAHVCAGCSDNFIVNSKLVTCRFCTQNYHFQCVQLKDQLYKTINECANLFWYCNDCVILVDERLNIEKRMANLERQAEENKITTTEILSRLETTSTTEKNENLWSTVVKKKKFPPLIIKPKNTNQDSATTKNIVTQKINPSELSVEVNKFKPVGKGSVVIECNDGESLKKLKNKAVAELSDNYTIDIPKIVNPKVVIVGIQETYLNTEEDFIQRVKSQICLSKFDENVTIKFVKKYIPKNKQLYNVVLEVEPEVFKCLIKHGRMFINWGSLPIYEYVGVLRCYKCWKYGHKAIHCQQPNIICPLCNQSHKSEDCKSTVKECTNCKYAHEVLKIPNIEFGHTVFDRDCVCYQRAHERAKSRTQYI